MTTTTDLKPGDVVQHNEKGFGIVARSFSRRIGVYYASFGGDDRSTADLDGWERIMPMERGHLQIRVDDLDLNHPDGIRALWLRVQRLTIDPAAYETYEERAAANNSRCNEVIRPGHVQLRVDDVDLHLWERMDEEDAWNDPVRLAIRAAKAKVALAESHKEPVQPETVADSDAPKVTTTITGATVHLPCTGCGEMLTDTASVDDDGDGGRFLTFSDSKTHICEPTERGARVTTRDGITEYRLIRALETAERVHGDGACWIDQDGTWWEWADVTRCDAVTLGWGEDQ